MATIEIDVDGDVEVSYHNSHDVVICIRTPTQIGEISLPMSALRKVFEHCEVEEKKLLDAELAEKQRKCRHKFERHEALFYALGETYPGKLCTKCGLRKRV